jgi:hypothetical protein
MIYIICAWMFWFFFCTNLGFFVLRNISKEHSKLDFFYNFWFGLFVLILVLEFIAQFLPLDGIVLLILTFIDISLFVLNLKYIKFKTKLIFVNLKKALDFKMVLLFVVLALLISFLSNLPITWYDTKLYHLNSVKWLVDYGTVRGLANLHWPLGINSVSFLLAAIMDNGIFSNSSSHVMNSFLFFIFTTQIILFIFKRSKNNLAYIFGLFSLLILSTFINQITSLATDLSLAVFLLVFVFYVITFNRKNLILSLPLLILAATTKASSFLPLSLFVLYLLIELKSKILVKQNLYIVLLASLFLIGFILRNLMLSGWALFPLPYSGFGFNWQLPYEEIKTINTIITQYNRTPGRDYLNSLSSGSGWIIKWLIMNKNVLDLYYFFLLVPLTFVYLFSHDKFRKQLIFSDQLRKIDFLIFVNILTALYAFIVAPELRYMGIYIYIAISLILSSYFVDFLKNTQLKSLMVLIFILSISGYLFKASAYFEAIELKNITELLVIRKDKSSLVKSVNISYPDQSFFILKPISGDQCGNSELPCTPLDSKIKLINPGNVGGGFYSVK